MVTAALSGPGAKLPVESSSITVYDKSPRKLTSAYDEYDPLQNGQGSLQAVCIKLVSEWRRAMRVSDAMPGVFP